MVMYCEGKLNTDSQFLKMRLNKNNLEITYLSLVSHTCFATVEFTSLVPGKKQMLR